MPSSLNLSVLTGYVCHSLYRTQLLAILLEYALYIGNCHLDWGGPVKPYKTVGDTRTLAFAFVREWALS